MSTIIPTYNRAELLRDRALPSVLAQDWPDIECIVVGDGTDSATIEFMGGLGDPRVRFVDLPRPEYPADPLLRWRIAGVAAINAGLEFATGAWVGILADDDAYEPWHHRVLLGASSDVGLVWGASDVYVNGARLSHRQYGCQEQLTTHDICVGAFLVRAEFGYRAGGGRSDWSWDANWWDAMIRDGIEYRRVPRAVHRYFPNPETMHLHGLG